MMHSTDVQDALDGNDLDCPPRIRSGTGYWFLRKFRLIGRIRCDTNTQLTNSQIAMKIRLKLTVLLLAALSFVGCATGDQWYHPYGPPYLGAEAPEAPTVNEFLSGSVPSFSSSND